MGFWLESGSTTAVRVVEEKHQLICSECTLGSTVYTLWKKRGRNPSRHLLGFSSTMNPKAIGCYSILRRWRGGELTPTLAPPDEISQFCGVLAVNYNRVRGLYGCSTVFLCREEGCVESGTARFCSGTSVPFGITYTMHNAAGKQASVPPFLPCPSAMTVRPRCYLTCVPILLPLSQGGTGFRGNIANPLG